MKNNKKVLNVLKNTLIKSKPNNSTNNVLATTGTRTTGSGDKDKNVATSA